MNLIKFSRRDDYGTDLCMQVCFTKHWALLQASISWCEYPGWPYIQIKSGSGSLLSVLFWAYKFGFDVDILSRTWNWNYLENVDEQETDYTELD